MDFITIYNKDLRGENKVIRLVSTFFKSKCDYIINYDSDNIYFKRPDISFNGKTYRACELRGDNNFTLTCKLDIPLGKFIKNEDLSNEDVIAFSFKN